MLSLDMQAAIARPIDDRLGGSDKDDGGGGSAYHSSDDDDDDDDDSNDSSSSSVGEFLDAASRFPSRM